MTYIIVPDIGQEGSRISQELPHVIPGNAITNENIPVPIALRVELEDEFKDGDRFG
jgi:hypothetical protein